MIKGFKDFRYDKDGKTGKVRITLLITHGDDRDYGNFLVGFSKTQDGDYMYGGHHYSPNSNTRDLYLRFISEIFEGNNPVPVMQGECLEECVDLMGLKNRVFKKVVETYLRYNDTYLRMNIGYSDTTNLLADKMIYKYVDKVKYANEKLFTSVKHNRLPVAWYTPDGTILNLKKMYELKTIFKLENID